MKNTIRIALSISILAVLCSCKKDDALKYGTNYQANKDYKSLKMAFDLMPKDIKPEEVKKILGEPIDMGFDYRYTTDSISPNNCVVGAVFNLDNKGNITQKWIGDICE